MWNVDVGGECPTTNTCALNLLMNGQVKYSQRSCVACGVLDYELNVNGPSKCLHVFFYQTMDSRKARWLVRLSNEVIGNGSQKHNLCFF